MLPETLVGTLSEVICSLSVMWERNKRLQGPGAQVTEESAGTFLGCPGASVLGQEPRWGLVDWWESLTCGR